MGMKTTLTLATTTAVIAVDQTLARNTASSANARIPTTSHRNNRTVATRITRATATATTTTTRRLASGTAAIAAQTQRSSTAQRANAWTRTTNPPLAVLPTTRAMATATTTTT